VLSASRPRRRRTSPSTRSSSSAHRQWSLADLDFSKLGSLNLIVVQFDRPLLPFDFLEEVRSLFDNALVRPDAHMLLNKDKDGNISGMEGSGLHEEEDTVALNAILAALANRSLGAPERARGKEMAAIRAAAAGDFGLPIAEIKAIADKLPPGHSAIVALFENVWERRLKEITKKYGGGLTRQELIAPDALARAMTAPAAAGKKAKASP
jgi:hypothetical protein